MIETQKNDALHGWLENIRHEIDERIHRSLDLFEEESFDARWSQALTEIREYAVRPGKRLRPALLVAGYSLTRGEDKIPEGLWRFATGLELLHTFMLIHDDIADHAHTRRGNLALHHVLGGGRLGEDSAVVAGDHLFARAIEVMLDSSLPNVMRVVNYYLGICRQTAVGQYLDLRLSHSPLSQVTLFQTLKVAQLKTARYGFVAPLVAGAMLANILTANVAVWERIGRNTGLAYQLKDDLMGLFGSDAVQGKAADSDFYEGKRTFPLIAAYIRADEPARRELEALWSSPEKDAVRLARARELIENYGGRAAAERAVRRATSAARQALQLLPQGGRYHIFLDRLIAELEYRRS